MRLIKGDGVEFDFLRKKLLIGVRLTGRLCKEIEEPGLEPEGEVEVGEFGDEHNGVTRTQKEAMAR